MATFVLIGAGDVLIDRSDPGSALTEVAPVLADGDLAFGNFEGVLTDIAQPIPGSAHATVVASGNAEGLQGFTVLSLANNHSTDAGYQGVVDTVDAIRGQNIQTAGAGANIAEAFKPAVVTRNGLRTAVVAVTSVLRFDVEARAQLPGVAPLRADEYFASSHPGFHSPGLAPMVMSVVNETDWARLTDAMASARETADFVAVSVHWGDQNQPWTLTEHERSCARRLVAAGADVVLGHHQHFMRGMEFIEGKPVFYGLGHLVFDHPKFESEMTSYGIEVSTLSEDQLQARFGEFGIYPRRDTPTLPFHPLTRRTGLVRVELDRSLTPRVYVIPYLIDTGGTPRRVRRVDGENWTELVDFFRMCQAKANLPTVVHDDDGTMNGVDVLEFTDDNVVGA